MSGVEFFYAVEPKKDCPHLNNENVGEWDNVEATSLSKVHPHPLAFCINIPTLRCYKYLNTKGINNLHIYFNISFLKFLSHVNYVMVLQKIGFV